MVTDFLFEILSFESYEAPKLKSLEKVIYNGSRVVKNPLRVVFALPYKEWLNINRSK